MIAEPKCWTRKCKHFIGVSRKKLEDERTEFVYCEAFPEGIPAIVAYGSVKHLTPLKGQGNKIVFEEKVK